MVARGAARVNLLSFVLGLSLGSTIVIFYGTVMKTNIQPSLGTAKHKQEHQHQDMDSFVGKSPHEHKRWESMLKELPGHKHDSADEVLHWKDKSKHSHAGEDLLSADLKQKVNVFCWIMTSPSNIESKARHVKATWARRFNKFIFMSSKEVKDLPAVALNVKEGRDYLWEKTKQAFRYVYKHHLNEHDWFMKADDDTYVVVENLRYMLKDLDPNKPYYIGRRFKPFLIQGYMSGGGGYVLSRKALKMFVEDGLDKDKPSCFTNSHSGAEDVNIGICLESLGVPVHDSLDSLKRERFHPFPPESHVNTDLIDKRNWLWSYNYHPLKVGPECCSDTSVTFHYISPHFMYTMEYLIYHLKPYGIVRDLSDVIEHLNKKQREHPAAVNEHVAYHRQNRTALTGVKRPAAAAAPAAAVPAAASNSTKAKPLKAKPSKAEPLKAKPSKAKPSKAKPSNDKSDKKALV